VLVHHGWGSWQELVRLAEHIKEKVYALFWIHITPEVNYISTH
jgi:UDP-N-acetylenolpyruvoylglucosamine reductase